MRLSPEQLTKSLESQGVRPETLKSRLKADMVWSSLVRGRFKESLQVGEKDVAAAAQESGDAKPETEAFEYKLQPIVLIVPRGSAPAAVDRGARRPKSLRERVQTCEEANSYFKSMQNAAIRETVTKTSADIPGPLARTARQDADRPFDPARGHQTGRRDGGAVRTEADQRSTRRRSGKSGKRCSPRNTRRNRKPI